MKTHTLVVAAAFVVAAVSVATPAGAGGFTAERGCDTLSTAPLRIVLKLELYDARDYGDLCAVRIRPTDAYGVPINPILDCITPSVLACAIDSAGEAIFSANPCLTIWGIGSPPTPAAWDSLGMVVGAPSGYYVADLIIPGGLVRKTDLLQYNCQAATATFRRSWGQLKTLYR